MKSIKVPALFLAQFAGDEAPFNSWDAITKWAGNCGYKGVQVPSWDGRLFDLAKAAQSKDYCDEFKGQAAQNGVEVTELSTHLQGQLVAVHPPVLPPPPRYWLPYALVLLLYMAGKAKLILLCCRHQDIGCLLH